jgi:hypothetical protein
LYGNAVWNRELREITITINIRKNRNENKLHLKRSLLMKGSPKTCPQTGSSVSDDANANPQLFNDDESSISALLYKS